jgi:hypothetical protein
MHIIYNGRYFSTESININVMVSCPNNRIFSDQVLCTESNQQDDIWRDLHFPFNRGRIFHKPHPNRRNVWLESVGYCSYGDPDSMGCNIRHPKPIAPYTSWMALTVL